MADIFDTLDAPPAGDVFDQVAPAASAGIPPTAAQPPADRGDLFDQAEAHAGLVDPGKIPAFARHGSPMQAALDRSRGIPAPAPSAPSGPPAPVDTGFAPSEGATRVVKGMVGTVDPDTGETRTEVTDAQFGPHDPPAVRMGHSLVIDPRRYTEGVAFASRQGWIGPEQAAEYFAQSDDVTKLADSRAKLIAEAGDNPELAALLSGVTRGTVTLGGMYAGGKALGGTVGAFTENPYLTGGAAIVGGTAGAIGAGKAYDKALEKLAPGNEIAARLHAATALQPSFAQSGELAALLLPAPLSVANLARGAGIVAAEKGAGAAAGFVAKQALGGAALATGTDLAIRGVEAAAGSKDAAPTVSGELSAAGVGALLSGLGVRFKGYSTPEVADILRRGFAVRQAAAAAEDGGTFRSPEPLSQREQAVFDRVAPQVDALRRQPLAPGETFDPGQISSTAQQVEGFGGRATTAETGIPIRRVQLEPEQAPSGSSSPSPAQTEFESQLATQGTVRGAPTQVLGAGGAEYPAAYAWAPRALLQASLTGPGMAANPAYPLTNTRDYTDPAEQDKALATRNGWDPRRHFTDSPDAAVGPPMVARVIDEQGQATLAVVGGNNRAWAIENLSPEQLARHDAAADAAAGKYGLPARPSADAEPVRMLGTFDFRQPGQRARLQGMVDSLNPSPGMVQASAQRAAIDATTLQPEQLAGLSMDQTPAEAQSAVRQLIAAGALDRNRTAAIAASPAQSQDYVQRLLVNTAFRQPGVAEARNDNRPGNVTLRGLIDAAVPAMVRLRQRGAAPIADSIARAFTTVIDATKSQGADSLPQALATVGAQHELDPVHAPAQAIAQALANGVVTDAKGRVQSEPTIEHARAVFQKIEQAVAHHSDQPDIFGEQTPLATKVTQGAALARPSDSIVREEHAPYNASPIDDHGIHYLAKPAETGHPSDYEPASDPARILDSLTRGDGGAVPAQRWKHGRLIASHARLLAWEGENRGRFLSAGAEKPMAGGGEHIVFDTGDGRVRKVTKPGLYGAQAGDAGAYLQRMALANRVFRDDLRFEGFIRLPGEDEFRAMISQPFIGGRDATEPEMLDELRARGFHPGPSGRFVHPVFGVSAWDTITPGNAIRTPDGRTVFIDLQLEPSRPEELAQVRAQGNIGQRVFEDGADYASGANPLDPAPDERTLKYLAANGITDPARRVAALHEFHAWDEILRNERKRSSYQPAQLQLDLYPPVGDRAARRSPAGSARVGAAGDLPSDAERAGAQALLQLARGVGLTPAQLDAAFRGGDTISSIVPRLVSLEIPRVEWRGTLINSVADWALLHRALRTPYVESFKFAILDPQNRIVHGGIMSTGTVNQTVASPREILLALSHLPALPAGQKYRVVESHNHPSGHPEPSSADLRAWDEHKTVLAQAGAELLDEAITNGGHYYSVAEAQTFPFLAPETPPDWELIPREQLVKLDETAAARAVMGTLRTSDPGVVHVVYGTTKLGITAIQRLPASTRPAEAMGAILRQSAKEGAPYVWISTPEQTHVGGLPAREWGGAVSGLLNRGTIVRVVDLATPGLESWRDAGLISEPLAKYRVAGLDSLAVQAQALETLREEPPEYTGLLAAKGSGFANVPLAGLDAIKIVQMPELVQLARELSGQLPEIKRMGKALGTFRPLGNGQIRLDPRIFADPTVAAKVLAHEFGHLAGWLPNKVMKRGNLHGWIHSLTKFLNDRFGAANISNKAMRAELIAVTQHWRPYDPATETASYVQYRESAAELYADAVSVLLNSPATLKSMAPKFYNEFFRGLDTKPEVKAQFFDLQKWLHRPMMATLWDRALAVDEMFAKAQEIFERKWAEREERYKGFGGWLSRLKQGFFDNYSPIVDRERAAGASLATNSARFLFDEHPLADNHAYRWLARMQQTVVAPAEAAGFTMDQVGQLLFFNRVANESYALSARQAEQMGVDTGGRSVIANPLGHTPQTARMQLLAMRLSYGIRGMTLLQHAVDKFHDEVLDVMKQAHAAGLLTPAQWELIQGNKANYATFTPLEYVDLFTPAGIAPQAGTLKEIQNPFVSTVVKTLAMHRAIQHQLTKTKAVEVLQRHFPAEIQPAETRRDATGRETPVRPREKGVDQIMVRQQGKPAWFNVPKEIALMFEHSDIPLLSSALSLLDAPFRKLFYPAYITFNPAFQVLRHPLRNLRRSYVNSPAGVGFLSIARQLPLIKQIGRNPDLEAVRAFVKKGQQHPIIAEMLDNLAIVPGEATFTATMGRPVNSFDRMLEKFGVLPPAEQSHKPFFTQWPVIGRVFHFLEQTGRMNELLPHVSVYRILTQKLGWSRRDAAFYARNYVGTPNFNKRGKHIKMLNTLTPFVNIWTKAWAADLEIMRHGYTRSDDPSAPGKSAASFWFRWAMTSGIWTVLKVAGALGLLGLAIKKVYDGVSHHQMANYDVIPLGHTGQSDYDPEGKSAFVTIPKDPIDRVISGVIYNLLMSVGTHTAKAGLFGPEVQAANAQRPDTTLGQAAQLGLGQIDSDVPGINPLIKLAAAWKTYLQGQNPVDDYRGTGILSDNQWLAGGWESIKPMLSWSFEQTGIPTIVSFDPKAGTTLEQIKNLPVLNGLFKISDYGHKETQESLERADQAAAAALKLGMPENARQLAAEYGFLSRVNPDARTPAQSDRYETLKEWRQSSYNPVEQQLRDAKENGLTEETRKSLLDNLKRESEPYLRKP